MQPAGIHHIALLARSFEQTVSFYSDILGLSEARRWHTPDGQVRSIWFALAGGAFLMVERADLGVKRGEVRGGGWFVVSLQIAPTEREAWRRHLSQQHINIIRETAYTLFVEDPEGNRIGLTHWPVVENNSI
ncbi:MAG: VOC family protein [Myxococcota bacterium]